jgi:hypothetical protein
MTASRTITFTLAAIAFAALAANAEAGSWPPVQKKSQAAEPVAVRPAKQSPETALPPIVGGFEYVGGDTGWQLAQHRYVLSGGAFVHSAECDHARRSAAATPTPQEIDALRSQSPGD